MSQAQRLQGLKGPTSSAAAATATTATIATVTTATTAAGLVVATQPQPHPTHGANASRPSSKSSTKKDKKEVSLLSGLPYNTALQNNLLNRCDWKNRLIYASRMLLGGNNVNGFLRGTATAQRIKKQRARQVGITKKTAASQAVLSAPESIESDKKEKKAPYHNEEEEQLKKDIMNPRTVKKLKCELEASLSFCAQLHNLLRGIILDVDRRQKPFLPPILIVEGDQSMTVDPPAQDSTFVTRPSAPLAPAPVPAPFGASSIPWTVKPVDSGASAPPKANSNKNPLPIKSTASPGNVEGSTLRKLRKTKLPPSTEPPPNLPEFDNAGRRLVNKTEHNIRLYEIMRFRALRRGDFVAARTTSRDLWILARVLKDYPSIDMAPLEFLQLTETRRDALFKDKVHVKDVEEKDGDNSFQVPRNLVLPLPRTYAEAAEWGQRIRKGMRVYSMYPNTTSLYPATVTDSTTYCRGDDDIIVVEFDGEEPDATGMIPKCHIPARFVTLIPREFSSSQPPSANKSNKRKSLTAASENRSKQKRTDDLLNFEDFDDNFDSLDLDFDQPMIGDDEDDGAFPPLL